jgi:hypothetical protein
MRTADVTSNASKIPTDPDIWLSRDDTAAALTELGLDTTRSTLATMAVRGGGPEFGTWGPSVRYRWGDVLAWAQQRLAKPRPKRPDHHFRIEAPV